MRDLYEAFPLFEEIYYTALERSQDERLSPSHLAASSYNDMRWFSTESKLEKVARRLITIMRTEFSYQNGKPLTLSTFLQRELSTNKNLAFSEVRISWSDSDPNCIQIKIEKITQKSKKLGRANKLNCDIRTDIANTPSGIMHTNVFVTFSENNLEEA